jgi:hypothetical protein
MSENFDLPAVSTVRIPALLDTGSADLGIASDNIARVRLRGE